MTYFKQYEFFKSFNLLITLDSVWEDSVGKVKIVNIIPCNPKLITFRDMRDETIDTVRLRFFIMAFKRVD
jgi:hypothetical protein